MCLRLRKLSRYHLAVFDCKTFPYNLSFLEDKLMVLAKGRAKGNSCDFSRSLTKRASANSQVLFFFFFLFLLVFRVIV